jgi:hypothetical protein
MCARPCRKKKEAKALKRRLEPMGILRTTQGRGDIKDHPKGAQLGAQQAGTNSVAISIQGMPFGHHTMLLPKFCVSVVDEVVHLTEILDGLASVSLFPN